MKDTYLLLCLKVCHKRKLSECVSVMCMWLNTESTEGSEAMQW